MLKTLSLILADETRDAPALQAAAALAAREGAQLDIACLGFEPVALEVVPMAAVQIIVESGRVEAQDRAEALVAWARARLPSGLGAQVEPVTVVGTDLAAMVARRARFADLAVATRPYGPGRNALAPALAEALLFGAGVPVLVAPDHPVDWSRPFRRLCLAWNGSPEALRAARAALPFLKAAEEVDVAIIDPPLHAPDRSDPGGDLSLWLARHGVKAEIAVMGRTQPRIADVLARFCAERGSEALVMGAYGHSRLREAVLGGATRDLLAAAPLPLIMAH